MKAYELLDSPEKWTRGESARTAAGQRASIHSNSACSWCVGGAIEKCYPAGPQRNQAWEKLMSSLDHMVTVWNDDPERTYEEVVGKLKELDI